MNKKITAKISLYDKKNSTAVITHATNEIIISRGTVNVLEMEDVLFHLDSAVMMPDNPSQSNASDGNASSEQKAVSGVRALALVFRQFQSTPDKKLLVAGHADRSGNAQVNFEISDLRARNVLLLLTGDRSEWASVCESRHKIEDYQQILQYFTREMSWNCDPGKIDNKWGTCTRTAITNFITHYNSFSWKPVGAFLDESLIDTIENSSEKKWPKAMWEAVYDLYEHEIILAVTGKHSEDEEFTKLRSALQFVDNSKHYVACGESFPVSKDRSSNYHSQQDRRVELLFFDKEEVPVLSCPSRITSVHTSEECPIYNKNCYTFNHIPPESFFTAVYHLSFVYYNRIAKKLLTLPDGIPIRVWKDSTTELNSTVKYNSGIFEITVKGITNTPREQKIHFTFETTDQWLVTASDGSVSIKTVDKTAFDKLTMAEKLMYYEIPGKWDSRNWQCTIEETVDVFEKQNMQVTSSAQPITFYLDDFLLCEDKSGRIVPIQWKSDHRFTLFDRTLTIIDPDPDRPFWSAGQLDKNYFHTSINQADYRLVALNGDFYDLTRGRIDNGEIIGIRRAVKNDPQVHAFEHLREPITNGAGNFYIHYFSECCNINDQACGTALVYWPCEFVIGNGNVSEIPDLDNFRKTGLITAKERWEKKNYLFVPDTDPENLNIRVQLRFFFEDNKNVATSKCTVRIHDPASPEYRSSMGLDSADFAKDTFQEDSTGTPSSEDGNDYFWYTMAHELGHGCGLDDEYIEPIEEDSDFVWSPVLPRYQQWYAGMPYSCDGSTMMVINRAPRLRHAWHYCTWVTKRAAEFTGNATYKVYHEGMQNGLLNTFNYFLEQKYENFYHTAFEKTPHNNGASGNFDLLLYKSGNDETTDADYVEIIPGQSDFDSILVVRINMHWQFKDFAGDTDGQWQVNLGASPKIHDKLSFLQSFQMAMSIAFQNTFWLEYSANDRTDFKKMYLYFLPHYLFENGAGDSSKTHFTITVRADDPVTGAAHGHVFTNNTITAGNDINAITLMRHTIGLPTSRLNAAGVSELITTIDAAELDFIATWVQTTVGAAHLYQVHS